MSSSDQSPTQQASPNHPQTSQTQRNSAVREAVKQCLEKGDQPATAARAHGVNSSAVRSALYRRRRPKPVNRENNKNVLREDQELALFRRVADQASSGEGVSLTKEAMFVAICDMRRLERKSEPSRRWFQMWVNRHKEELRGVQS